LVAVKGKNLQRPVSARGNFKKYVRKIWKGKKRGEGGFGFKHKTED